MLLEESIPGLLKSLNTVSGCLSLSLSVAPFFSSSLVTFLSIFLIISCPPFLIALPSWPRFCPFSFCMLFTYLFPILLSIPLPVHQIPNIFTFTVLSTWVSLAFSLSVFFSGLHFESQLACLHLINIHQCLIFLPFYLYTKTVLYLCTRGVSYALYISLLISKLLCTIRFVSLGGGGACHTK